MPSPVLEEIKTLLVTVYPDRFKDPIDKCLGTNKGDGQSCKRWSTQRDIATQRMRSLASLGEVPHDESFFREVEDFLRHSHCSCHQGVALDKFRRWKQKRQQPVVDPVAPAPASPTLDGSHDADQSDEHPPLPNILMQTPKTLGGDTTDSDKSDLHSDAWDSTTPSPSQESEIGSVASPASTAITTPGSIPPDNPMVAHFDAFDDIDPPATPTPAPRKSSRPVADPEATEEVLTDDDNPAQNTNPANVLGVTKRMQSVKSQKWPLLRVIERSFKARDSEDGRVYVWKHETEERLVKIGFTATGSKDRRQQSNNCYAKNTKEQWKSPVSFVGAYRVESLVRKSLGTRNIELESCSTCGAGHREWYELHWEEAVEEIEIWTQFVTKAYDDGKLSKKGQQMMDAICHPNVAKWVDMLSADAGSVLAEGLTAMSKERSEAGQHTTILDEQGSALAGDEELSADIGSVLAEGLTAMSEESSEAGQHAIILEGQVSALAGDEELPFIVNLAPDPDSTDQNPALSSPGQAKVKESRKSGARAAIRDFMSDLKKRASTQMRGSYSGRKGYSEQAKEKRDEKQFLSKLLRQFWSAELKEVEDKLGQNQPDPADARDDVPSKKREWAWKLDLKLRNRWKET